MPRGKRVLSTAAPAAPGVLGHPGLLRETPLFPPGEQLAGGCSECGTREGLNQRLKTLEEAPGLPQLLPAILCHSSGALRRGGSHCPSIPRGLPPGPEEPTPSSHLVAKKLVKNLLKAKQFLSVVSLRPQEGGELSGPRDSRPVSSSNASFFQPLLARNLKNTVVQPHLEKLRYRSFLINP